MSEFLLENVLIINLDKDVKRWESISSGLEKIGIKSTRIPAIYGKELPRMILEEHLPKLKTAGAIGCAYSHRKSWTYIVENNLPYATILEDDATITEGVSSLYNKKLELNIPKNWAVVYLGHTKAVWPRNTCSRVSQPAYSENENNSPIKINKHLIKFTSSEEAPMGLWAYCITNDTAKYLLENYKLKEPVDVFLVKKPFLKDFPSYGVVPSIFTHCYGHGTNIRHNNPVDDIYEHYQKTKSSIIFGIFLILFILLIIALYKKANNKIIFGLAVLNIIVFIYLVHSQTSKEMLIYTKKYYNVPNDFGRDPFDPFGNVWTEKNKIQSKYLLKYLVDMCNSVSPPIKVYLYAGTLLGWARHNGKAIPWDDDMDVAIIITDKERLLNLLKNQKDLGYASSKNFDLKIWFLDYKHSEEIIGRKWRFPFVDIFFFNEDGTIKVEKDKIIQFEDKKFLKDNENNKVVFEDVKGLYVPTIYKKHLDNRYGTDWKKMCVSSSWCHRTEKPINRKYRDKQECSLVVLKE